MAVHLLEYYQQLRKILKVAISMKFVVSKDKLTISGVRNWLKLGAIHVANNDFWNLDSYVTANPLVVT